MPFCPKCGNEVSIGAKKCWNCGQKIDAHPPAAPAKTSGALLRIYRLVRAPSKAKDSGSRAETDTHASPDRRSWASNANPNPNSEFLDDASARLYCQYWSEATVKSYAQKMKVEAPLVRTYDFDPKAEANDAWAAYYKPFGLTVYLRIDLLTDMFLWDTLQAQRFWKFALGHEFWHYYLDNATKRENPLDYPKRKTLVEKKCNEMGARLSGVSEQQAGAIERQFILLSHSRWITLPNGEHIKLYQ